MSTISISWKEYPATPGAESFITNYLERVRRYVSSNGISGEYAQDIENRLAEKLAYVWGECSESDAVRIVNELWEPEDVFVDAPRGRNAWFADIASAVKGNMKSPLYRDSSKGMIFGVCAGLWDKFDVDPFFIRLLFVFLFFFYWTGVFAYLVLAILMKDRAKIENPEAFAEKRVREGVSAAAGTFASVPQKTVEAVRWGVNVALAAFGFLFFGFLAAVLFFASLGFFAAFWISVSGIVVENQNVFGGAHPSLPFAVWAAWASLFVLSWIAGFRAFWKKISNAAVLIIAGLVLAGSVGAGAYGTFKTVANFAKRESSSVVLETGISTGGVTIGFTDTDEYAGKNLEFPKWTEIRLAKSVDSKLRIRAVTEVSAKDSETAKEAFASIAPAELSVSWTTLSVRNAEVSYVKTWDYAFAKRVIEISVPESVRIRLSKLPRSADVEGLSRTEFDSYASYDGRCSWTELKYAPESESFVCDPFWYSAAAYDRAKLEYLERSAYEIAPRTSIKTESGESVSYRYDDNAEVKAMTGWLYQVTYELRYQHPGEVPGSIVKTYRVDVSPYGDVSHEEVAKPE